jgi:hypothetical protein
MLFELRQYRIKDGKRDQWVKLMEEQIIPFQTSMGVVVVAVLWPRKRMISMCGSVVSITRRKEKDYIQRSMKATSGSTKSNRNRGRCWIEKASSTPCWKQHPNRFFGKPLPHTNPRMIPVSHPLLRPEVEPGQIQKYSQKTVDVFNLKTGRLEPVAFLDLMRQIDHPDLYYAVSVNQDGNLPPHVYGAGN